MRDILERHQVWIYFGSIALAACAALLVPKSQALEPVINPALGFMLFVTFLQVPLSGLFTGLRNLRFFAALLTANFIAIPVLVYVLSRFAPDDTMVQLGVLMVLLTPCIDYVITFANLGRADARLLLASTPLLLIAQIALLPVYLHGFLGDIAANLISLRPFLDAFLWLIFVPLILAAFFQFWASRNATGRAIERVLGLAPVPATALVLFLVVASTLPVLGNAAQHALVVLPIYIIFACAAPLIGWIVARAYRLNDTASRAVAFSAATRNSLVILPLALAIPGGAPVLPAIIITQTLCELVAELFYVRLLPKLGIERTSG